MKITKYKQNFTKMKLMSEMDKDELLSTALQLSAKNERLIKENVNHLDKIEKYIKLLNELYEMAKDFKKLNFFQRLLKGLAMASKITKFIMEAESELSKETLNK